MATRSVRADTAGRCARTAELKPAISHKQRIVSTALKNLICLRADGCMESRFRIDIPTPSVDLLDGFHQTEETLCQSGMDVDCTLQDCVRRVSQN